MTRFHQSPSDTVVPVSRPTPIAAAVRSVCFAMAMVAPVGFAYAQQVSASAAGDVAQNASERSTYDIASGPLADRLREFAMTAGVTLQTDATLMDGKSTAGVQGSFTEAEAIAALLRGTGLEAVERASRVYVLRTAANPTKRISTTETALPPVTVTAAAEPELAPVEPGIVTSRGIERYVASDLEDVFSSQPEVVVGGGHGIAQKVYLRGIEDTMLNVTVDGAQQAGQTFHHTGRIQIEPELIKRVEVRGGAGDATAGPGALGGVIRFVTKDAQDLLGPEQRVGAQIKSDYYGNAEGYKLHGSAYARLNEEWAVLAAVTRLDQENYEDGAGNEVRGTGSEQDLGFFKLTGKLQQGHTLRLSHESKTDEGERAQKPQWVYSGATPLYSLQAERSTWTLGYAWNPDNRLIDLDASTYQTQSDIEQNVFNRWGVYVGKTQSRGMDLRNTSRWDNLKLTYGADYRHDEITAGAADTPAAEREKGSVTGLYVQGTAALGQSWELGFGTRYDEYELTNVNGQRHESDGFSPNISVRHALNENVTVFAGHARALRGATIRDAFKLDAIATNAPDREPERSRTTEAGVETRLGAWRLNGKLYTTTIKNAVADPIGGPTQYENVGTLESDGVLLHLAYAWQRIDVGVGYHHNRATLDGQRLNSYEHNGLGTTQGDTLTASLNYRLTDRAELGWTGRFVAGTDTRVTGEGTVRKPGYGVHDFFASWRAPLANDLRLALVVKNAFDKDYLDHGSNEDLQHFTGYEGIVGSHEPGREIRLSASLRF